MAESNHTPDLNGPLLITGAAGAIGGAVAASAVEAGLGVALVDHDASALAAAVDAIPPRSDGTSPEVVSIGCDVTDEDAVEATFASVTERLGPPTSLVTAVGIDRGALIDAMEPSVWDEVLAVNLRGTFLTCRAAVCGMLEAGGGSIVCISSPLAFVATPGSAAYGASKGGVSALVRSLAVDYASHGIRVNALLPGPTESDLMWANVPDSDLDRVRESISREVPLGRIADPSEIAHAALWLLSEDASYVTGAQVPCDGGVLAKASVSV